MTVKISIEAKPEENTINIWPARALLVFCVSRSVVACVCVWSHSEGQTDAKKHILWQRPRLPSDATQEHDVRAINLRPRAHKSCLSKKIKINERYVAQGDGSALCDSFAPDRSTVPFVQ